MKLRFEKWEGLGNDFVLVLGGEDTLSKARVEAICDRRFGVGGDGVLLVDVASPRMIVFNADGSRPEMCGNGLRCVAAFITARSGSSSSKSAIDVATDAGVRRCDVSIERDGFASVAVDMGVTELGDSLEVDGASFRRVGVGNPHAITFDGGFDDARIDRVASIVQSKIAGSANVEFCDDEGDAIRVVVVERGVGRTLACGTGACAVAAAACADGRRAYDTSIEVRLPGGALRITVDRSSKRATMTGPARRVFQGEVELA